MQKSKVCRKVYDIFELYRDKNGVFSV
jgi:hypothetical protein